MIDTLFSEVNINTIKGEDIQLNTEQFFINFNGPLAQLVRATDS